MVRRNIYIPVGINRDSTLSDLDQVCLHPPFYAAWCILSIPSRKRDLHFGVIRIDIFLNRGRTGGIFLTAWLGAGFSSGALAPPRILGLYRSTRILFPADVKCGGARARLLRFARQAGKAFLFT